MILKAKQLEKSEKNNNNNKRYKDYLNKDLVERKLKVYEHQVNEFLKIINNDKVKLIPFLNVRSYLFEKKNGIELSQNQMNRINNFNMVKSKWNNHGINDPFNFAVKYLNKNNLNRAPWLGRTCDDHYSEIGAEFIASFAATHFKIIENENN
jgi:hypothetical protein